MLDLLIFALALWVTYLGLTRTKSPTAKAVVVAAVLYSLYSRFVL